jgi:hypothetical protein
VPLPPLLVFIPPLSSLGPPLWLLLWLVLVVAREELVPPCALLAALLLLRLLLCAYAEESECEKVEAVPPTPWLLPVMLAPAVLPAALLRSPAAEPESEMDDG